MAPEEVSKTWTYQTQELQKDFNLLLLDLRDHGKSRDITPSYEKYRFSIISEDILRVVDQLKIEQAHFISLSFGSVLLQDLSMRRPGLINKMVMAGGVFKGTTAIRSFVRLARLFNLFLPYEWMYRMFSFLLMPKKRNQHARRIYRLTARKLNPEDYMKWVGLYDEFFLLLKTFYFHQLQSPTLVLMGQDDFVFLKGARGFVKLQPMARLIEMPKTGHICNIEKPLLFNQLVNSFLTVPDQERKPGSIETFARH